MECQLFNIGIVVLITNAIFVVLFGEVMSKTFLISDTHFGHGNILKFKRGDGTPLRVFNDIIHMNTVMIDNWNRVVGKDDKVYHLGDVAMGNATYFRSTMARLNGHKILIKGNHDQLKPALYLEFFKDVRAYHQLDGFLLAHIPVHPASLSRWKGQIHGHLHADRVQTSAYSSDVRYINVAVEQINYTPINFEEIRSRYK